MIKRRADYLTEARTTAVHESAHGCAAISLGLRFRTIDIFIHEGGDGHITGLRLRYGVFSIERMILVLYAGAMAQRRFSPSSKWQHGSRSDRRSADVWLQRLLSVDVRLQRLRRGNLCGDYYFGDPEFLPSHLDRQTLDRLHVHYRLRAAGLVARLWPQIERVAAKLFQHKFLTYAEVRKLMTAARRLHVRQKGSRHERHIAKAR
jgi:hypothetical protein